MKRLAILLIIVAGVGLFLPWLQVGDDAVALRNPDAGPGEGDPPRSPSIMIATDGPFLLGMAAVALVFLLVGLARPAARWPSVLAFLVAGGMAAFAAVDWLGTDLEAPLLGLGDFVYGPPREIGIGAPLATIGAGLAALLALGASFGRREAAPRD